MGRNPPIFPWKIATISPLDEIAMPTKPRTAMMANKNTTREGLPNESINFFRRN